MSHPLQNRVTPFGEIVAAVARGTMMGNRGGRLHDDHKRLGKRRWASRTWICCELSFKGWHREVMASRNTYTELFFLDEVTALAAGHRPCFECRRVDAQLFQAAFPIARAKAGQMDEILHAERLGERPLQLSDNLPDGTVWADGPDALTHSEGRVVRWSFHAWQPVPDWHDKPVRVLTPRSIVTALGNGFRPRWHESARGQSRPSPSSQHS